MRIPEKVYKEVTIGNDDLVSWIKTYEETFFCKEECIFSLPDALVGYGNPTEADLEFLKADPYIIAHALAFGGTVVTGEKPKDTSVVKNKSISTICSCLRVPCLTLPGFMWELRSTMPL